MRRRVGQDATIILMPTGQEIPVPVYECPPHDISQVIKAFPLLLIGDHIGPL
jgi:hypothetical protein